MKNDKDPPLQLYQVNISEPAEDDLRSIVRYISVQLSAPMATLSILDSIEDAMTKLAEVPYRTPAVADKHLAGMGYRKLIVKNYIIFFSIDEKAKMIDVERILYSRRNWRAIL